MKRKILERYVVLEATESIQELVRFDMPEKRIIHWTYSPSQTVYTYKRYIYFQARIVEENILQVSMYLRSEIKRGRTAPHFSIFIDKEKGEFATYNLIDKKWSKAKIDMLDYKREKGMDYENIPYADTRSEDIVNKYFDTSKQHIKKLVLDFQVKVRKEELKQRHRSEMDEIDEVMELVPEIPSDFREWVLKYGLHGQHYIIYQTNNRKQQSGKCLHCGNEVVLTGARRDKFVKCPSCKIEAYLKPRSSTEIRHNVNIGMLQRLTDDSGWVVRRFRAFWLSSKAEDWKPKLYLDEEVRETYSNDLVMRQHYEYGCYKQTGVNRWCYCANEPNRKGWYRDDFAMGEVRFYWKNLCRERKDTVLKYIPLEKALRKSPGTYIHVHDMMYSLSNNPSIEYLIKMGFRRLAVDVLKGRVKIQQGKRPWQVLGVSKELMMNALKWDVNYSQLEVMKDAESMGYRLTKEETVFYTTYLKGDLMKKLFRYSTPHKYYRYFTEVLKEKKNLGDYMDYLEAAVLNGYDMKNEMVLFPKQFRTAHDMAIEERVTRENRIKAMEAAERDREYAKMLPDIRKTYEFEDDDFFIKVPEKRDDFVKEGHMNHNCVATYFDKVLRGQCVVVFMRKKAEPEVSFCTVEITNVASIQQLRSGYNRAAPKEAEEFAQKWMREVKKRFAKKEKPQKDKIKPAVVACAG